MLLVSVDVGVAVGFGFGLGSLFNLPSRPSVVVEILNQITLTSGTGFTCPYPLAVTCYTLSLCACPVCLPVVLSHKSDRGRRTGVRDKVESSCSLIFVDYHDSSCRAVVCINNISSRLV